MKIEPLTKEHLKAFVAFRNVSKEECSFLNGMTEEIALNIITNVTKIYHNYVMCDGGVIVGQLFLMNNNKTSMHICLISVLNKCRGTGAGAQLLKFAEEYSKTQGCNQITLTVSSRNTNAIGFYKHHGYSVLSKSGVNLKYKKDL